jgi:hypothetical protein
MTPGSICACFCMVQHVTAESGELYTLDTYSVTVSEAYQAVRELDILAAISTY